MIINKAILAAHGVCGSGYDKFVELFGDGDAPYDECLEIVRELERVDPVGNRVWFDFVQKLPQSAKFHAMQNLGHAVEKYRVFNSVSGGHIEVTSKQEAEALQASLQAEYIESHVKQMFNYVQAYVTENGDELWVSKE